MTRSSGGGVYERLGVLPVINLWGSVTGFGGFVPSPAVEAAMNEANERYVDMMELATRAGEHIAEALGTEAAFVSPGGIAGLGQHRDGPDVRRRRREDHASARQGGMEGRVRGPGKQRGSGAGLRAGEAAGSSTRATKAGALRSSWRRP